MLGVDASTMGVATARGRTEDEGAVVDELAWMTAMAYDGGEGGVDLVHDEEGPDIRLSDEG